MKALTMNWQRHLILAFCMLFFGTTIQAQNVDVDLQAIKQAYAQALQLEMKESVSHYPSHEANEATRTYQVVIRKQGQLLQTAANGVETTWGEDFKLEVNHDRGLIMLEDLEEAERNSMGQMDFTALPDRSSKVEYTALSENEGRYTFYFADGALEKMEIHFDRNTKLLQKQVLYSRLYTRYDPNKPKAKERMEVVMITQDCDAQFEAEQFAGSAILHLDQQPIAVNKKYQTYVLHDYRR